jgi:hypothetical protein
MLAIKTSTALVVRTTLDRAPSSSSLNKNNILLHKWRVADSLGFECTDWHNASHD